MMEDTKTKNQSQLISVTLEDYESDSDYKECDDDSEDSDSNETCSTCSDLLCEDCKKQEQKSPKNEFFEIRECMSCARKCEPHIILKRSLSEKSDKCDQKTIKEKCNHQQKESNRKLKSKSCGKKKSKSRDRKNIKCNEQTIGKSCYKSKDRTKAMSRDRTPNRGNSGKGKSPRYKQNMFNQYDNRVCQSTIDKTHWPVCEKCKKRKDPYRKTRYTKYLDDSTDQNTTKFTPHEDGVVTYEFNKYKPNENNRGSDYNILGRYLGYSDKTHHNYDHDSIYHNNQRHKYLEKPRETTNNSCQDEFQPKQKVSDRRLLRNRCGERPKSSDEYKNNRRSQMSVHFEDHSEGKAFKDELKVFSKKKEPCPEQPCETKKPSDVREPKTGCDCKKKLSMQCMNEEIRQNTRPDTTATDCSRCVSQACQTEFRCKCAQQKSIHSQLCDQRTQTANSLNQMEPFRKLERSSTCCLLTENTGNQGRKGQKRRTPSSRQSSTASKCKLRACQSNFEQKDEIACRTQKNKKEEHKARCDQQTREKRFYHCDKVKVSKCYLKKDDNCEEEYKPEESDNERSRNRDFNKEFRKLSKNLREEIKNNSKSKKNQKMTNRIGKGKF